MTGGQAAGRRANGLPHELTVATLNLYLGADLAPVLLATTAPDLQEAVERTLARVAATDFPARARTMARLIAAASPDIIGLQEAVIWDDSSGGPPVPGGRLDDLSSLLEALQTAGVPYTPAAIGPGTPVTSPAGTRPTIRFTNRNVILVRDGNPALSVRGVQAAHFMTNLIIPSPQLGPVPITRGWTSVDTELGGHRLRFVVTHLEDRHAPIQEAQAAEVVETLGALEQAVILVGDFNASPTAASPTYTTLTASGLEDVWAIGGGSSPGNTCCQAPDLRNAVSTLADRIDWVMIRGSIEVVDVFTFGDLPSDRTPNGWWSSDHAGVVARLRLA